MSNNVNDIDIKDFQEQSYCTKIIVFLSFILLVLTFPLSVFGCFKVVKEYERAVVFRLGRIRSGERGPGLFFINPFIEKCIVLDHRIISFIIPSQEILSKDSVSVNIDGVVYFQVINTVKAINNVEDYLSSTKLLSQTILRNISGTMKLLELLVLKEDISHKVQKILNEATIEWGIKVYRVELKDICIPKSIQRAMAIEGEASREAEARYITADGENKASNALKEAADLMSSNPTAIYLRYLQTLNNVGQENSTTIVFPFPIELMNNLFQNFNSIKSIKNKIH
uniref:PHB domain-containing protein n=1 Tax=Strongyloides papillosus TaxID=174720 RepID=A0A0N5C7H3_STREA